MKQFKFKAIIGLRTNLIPLHEFTLLAFSPSLAMQIVKDIILPNLQLQDNNDYLTVISLVQVHEWF